MSRLECIILSILLSEEAVNSMSAMSVYEIADRVHHSYKADSIYRKIVELIKKNCVKIGCKDGKANTYYITEEGKTSLEETKRAG